VRERDRREGGVPGNVLVPVRVFVHLIYSTLSIGPGNGSVLSQNFGAVPIDNRLRKWIYRGGCLKTSTSINGSILEAVVLK